ncbi:MAG TPA: VanZ family protein [Opitutaceae bacterium]|nr:VanZ family protein [Opitutaceae bacterium]
MSNVGEAKDPSIRANTTHLGAGSLAWPVTLAAMILIASGRSMTGAPLLFPHADKLIHFFIFGLLATLVLRTGAIWRRGASRGWITVLAVAMFGILDEFRQSFTPGRFVEFADWAADTLGASVAVCAYLFWGGYRALLEMPLWTRKRDLPSSVEESR